MLSLGQSCQELREFAEHFFVFLKMSQIHCIFKKTNANITQRGFAIRKILTGCIHGKEQKHKYKQNPDKVRYLNILKTVFRVKHLHNHLVTSDSKYKTNL